jgi:hypothetical protein
MTLYNVRKSLKSNIWIICEGIQETGCAGEYESKAEAQEVAVLLNDAYREVKNATKT